MGETVRWAQNCLRIFKLSKSVNGKGRVLPMIFCLGGVDLEKNFEPSGGEKIFLGLLGGFENIVFNSGLAEIAFLDISNLH